MWFITHTYCFSYCFRDFLFLIVGKQWVSRKEIWQRSLVTKMVLFTQFYLTIAWHHNTGSDIYRLYSTVNLSIISSLTITNIVVLYMIHTLTMKKWKSFDWAFETEWNKDRNSIRVDFVGLFVHGIKKKQTETPRPWNIIWKYSRYKNDNP